jgi:O-antigen/teichoic acid export membrane protein
MQTDQGERRAIIREATAFSLASYLFQLISVLRGFVVAWFLGPALYGVWNIFKTFLETGNYVSGGAAQAVARELPFNKAQGDDGKNRLIASSTLALCILVSVVLGLAALGFSWLELAAPYRLEIRICAFAFVLNAVHLYVPNQLKGEKRIYMLALYYIAYALLNALFGLLLMLVWGIGGLLLGMLITNALMIGWLLYKRYLPRRPALHWPTSRQLMNIGFPILFVAIAPKLMASLDKLVIFSMLGSVATGYYSMAAFFSETINYIPLALATVLFPRLMYQKGKGADLSQMGYLYDKPIIFLAWLIPVILGLLVLNIGVVIEWILPAYTPAIPVLQILLAGLFFTVIWSVPRGLLVVFDKQRVFIVAIPLLLLLGTLLNVAAIKLGFGIGGVACASVLFYFLVSTLANYYALGVLQRSGAQKLQTMLQIHLPFVYGVIGVLLLQRYVHVQNEWLQSGLRSLLFLVYCLPLIVYADRKLKLFASLRAALFKPA